MIKSHADGEFSFLKIYFFKSNPPQVVVNSGNSIFYFYTWLGIAFKSQDSFTVFQPKQE
ncbi:hypothetical protein MNBD_GAMMA08-464 [hydrothermal vent metagenome]|uniref:Uncharacterized protein n=1 Tax=hydrothermal vent metagenome TaxID=652676 RepID=A0A3B0XM53_9ZZZZ